MDGGSTDKTRQVAKQFSAKVITTPNSTVTKARQRGIEAARGKIIVGADADTVYPVDHLERIKTDFENNPGIIAVGGGGVFESKPWWVYWGWKAAYLYFAKMYKLFGAVIYTPAFNLSFKKEIFIKIGGYDTNLDYGGDELDILKRLKTAGRVYFDDQLKPNPSSRRAKVGFWKLIVKHTLIDYYLSFFLAKFFKKTIIKGHPVR